LDAQCILEIGCGNGNALDEFAVLGAGPGNLHGVDLIADRIATAKAQYPGFDFHCANAEALGFPDSTFDLVLLFTVFSSIADLAMQENVSREASRVLKKMGAVMWYDLRYNNPGNPNVRGITKRDIQRLFPDFMISLRTLTLLPPLARRLGPGTAVLYPLLSRIPFLRTHYIGLLSRA